MSPRCLIQSSIPSSAAPSTGSCAFPRSAQRANCLVILAEAPETFRHEPSCVLVALHRRAVPLLVLVTGFIVRSKMSSISPMVISPEFASVWAWMWSDQCPSRCSRSASTSSAALTFARQARRAREAAASFGFALRVLGWASDVGSASGQLWWAWRRRGWPVL